MNQKRIIRTTAGVLMAALCLTGCTQKIPLTNNQQSQQSTEEIKIDAPQNGMTKHGMNLQSVSNARQLGGYEAEDGKRVKDDVLFRSGDLSLASKEDIRKLEMLQISLIIDLRNETEAKEKPDRDMTFCKTIHLPIQKEYVLNKKFLSGFTGTSRQETYLNMAVNEKMQDYYENRYIYMLSSAYSQELFTEMFDTIVEQGGAPILLHSAEGKDRCGVAAMLLLGALGADRETMIDDYLISNEVYQTEIKSYVGAGAQNGLNKKAKAALAAQAGVVRSNMEAALDFLEEEYDGIDEYLTNQLSLTEREKQLLREWYLEEGDEISSYHEE